MWTATAAGAVVGLVVIVSTVLALAAQVDEVIFVGFFALTFGVPLLALISSTIRRVPFDPLSPFLLVPVTMGIVYGGAPALLAREGSQDLAATVAAGLTVGMAAYFAGVFFMRFSMLPTGEAKFFVDSTPLRPGRIYAIFGVGLAAMLVFWARAGGVPFLMADLENSRISALTGSGVPFYLSMLMMVAFWISLGPESNVPRWAQLAMFVVGAIMLTTTGWRNTVFAFVVVSIFLLYYTRRVRATTIGIVALVAIVGAVALGLFRVVSSNLTSYRTYQEVMSGDLLAAVGSYLATYTDAFARNLAIVFEIVPDALAFQGGKTLIWNFLTLAPESDLEPFDFVLKRAAGEGFEGGGLPPTLVGEWYLNYSWLGVVLGMALVGAAMELAHRAVRSARSFTTLVIAVLVIYYAFVSVRGGLGNVLLTLTWLALATLIVSRFARARQSNSRVDVRPNARNTSSPPSRTARSQPGGVA